MPIVRDNIKYWQVFEDDKQVESFLKMDGEFANLNIDEEYCCEEEDVVVRKIGPWSNKTNAETKHRRHTIQERHRFTWFTQCGLHPPEKLPGPSFIII
jgi:hypothetical protein